MNKKIEVIKICNADNKLQKLNMYKSEEIKKIHEQYSIISGEKEIIEKLIKKYGG